MSVTPAGVGGVVDPRIGDESEFIATRRDSAVKAIAPPEAHGHNNIYLDTSISFEAYRFYADRAREHERGLSTDSVAKQLSKIVSGRKASRHVLRNACCS